MLVFCGNPGIGKTFFCAALSEWSFKKFKTRRYWTEAQLLKRIRSGMETFKGDYIDHLIQLFDDELIILDDVGSQGINDWRSEVLFDALDFRYNSMLPTVITSNFSSQDFKDKYHKRVHSRLFATENTIIELHDLIDKRSQGL